MSKTNEYSSNASKEVNEINMGFTVTGGFFTQNKDKQKKDKLFIKSQETINKEIPMFEIQERSVGKYTKEKDKNGNEIIVTEKHRFVKDENGKYKPEAIKTKSVER